jgi:hypothetical protein
VQEPAQDVVIGTQDSGLPGSTTKVSSPQAEPGHQLARRVLLPPPGNSDPLLREPPKRRPRKRPLWRGQDIGICIGIFG